ncbi:putative membrane protein [Selenomonas ruminantium subsp. lactilytica TAM6421]|uniref:Putative membrane protein n=1 Tax=Selenomonas ruminantium subsp. lactilytica (strain NBRC 103574 / TAM6421) TaxID=927704 RepID=I0GRQ0_SELRL|nr:O-antigen polymerase [Selenomonas ruminantium]BAL83437.1 putative membrane protein [Selenomonas ruminantium subsp. lactilytica TAM6421]
MNIIVAFGTLLLCAFCYRLDNCIYNPATVYSFFWFMIMLLASAQFYDIYEISNETYFLAFVSVCFFVIGHILNLVIRNKFNIKHNKFDINLKFYYVLLIACVISLWQNFSLIGVVISEGLSVSAAYFLMARVVVGEAEELKDVYTDLGAQVQQYIGYPLLYLLIPTSILLYYKTFKKKYLLIAFGLFLIRFLADFKRTILVFLILFFLFYAILMRKSILNEMRKNILIKRKIKWFSFGIIIALFSAFLVISTLRHDNHGDSYSLFQNLYYYYIGCFKLLDIRLSTWDMFGVDYTFGLTTFRGVFAPFFATIKLLINEDFSLFADATYLVNSLHDYIVPIAPHHIYNTYTTNVFQFYCDGGGIGVCVLSMLYGWLASSWYRDYCELGDVRSVFRFGYIMCVFILFSNMHMNSIVICYVWPLILERLLYNKKIKNV